MNKIGYPCINYSIGCRPDAGFILRNYSKKRFLNVTRKNLECLFKILEFNLKNNILFFRISSDIIPFASHPVCNVNWIKEFKDLFEEIGYFIRKNDIRISMHPDQFVVLNSENKSVLKNSIRELIYHAEFLDALNLDEKAKIQIHVGGLYDDKDLSIKRFIKNYNKLPEIVKRRLVIENDEKNYSVKDCLKIYEEIGIPIVFDNLHHEVLNNGEDIREAMIMCFKTWQEKDGLPMIDYSQQNKKKRRGSHAETLDPKEFRLFVEKVKDLKFDIMLEIKDKEKSALKALKILKELNIIRKMKINKNNR